MRVHSTIVYSCPADHVFEHNTYGEPRWLIRCTDDGKWTTGDFWPKCINLSESFYLIIAFVGFEAKWDDVVIYIMNSMQHTQAEG